MSIWNTAVKRTDTLLHLHLHWVYILFSDQKTNKKHMVDQMFKHAIEKINAGKEKMEFWSGVGTIILHTMVSEKSKGLKEMRKSDIAYWGNSRPGKGIMSGLSKEDFVTRAKQKRGRKKQCGGKVCWTWQSWGLLLYMIDMMLKS